LVSTVAWAGLAAVLAGAGVLGVGRGRQAAWVMAAAVASHFLCDAVVHVRGLPLLRDVAPRVGLGLWRVMGVALGLELLLLGGGTWLFLRSRPELPVVRRGVLLGVLVVLAVLQVVGQLAEADAPPPAALALTWLAQTLVLVLLGLWADRGVAPEPVGASVAAARDR